MDESGCERMILEPLKLPELKDLSLSPERDQVLPCLLCDEEFSLEDTPLDEKKEKADDGRMEDGAENNAKQDGQDKLLRHLLLKHSFVIADVHMIADFYKYIRYWKSKFQRSPLTAYCTTMKADVTDKVSGSEKTKQKEFSLLSDIVPEDRALREMLQQTRLEEVLGVHQAENSSQTFHRCCLFCKQMFTAHSALFDHMAFDHNFSVGQPANIVFANKFLDLLDKKLKLLLCLFCEKTFKTRDVLKEHMRKKGHKKLNPRNKEYDQFYLVNYLEFGRNWEDISKEPAEEEVMSGFDLATEEVHDWSDWKDNVGKVVCLFCPASYDGNKDLFEHMTVIHGFHFDQLRKEQKLDFYQQIKLVNYIRRCVYLHNCIGCAEGFESREKMLEHLSWSNHLPSPTEWNQPQFFFPTYENDNLLHTLDEIDEDAGGGEAPVLPEELGPHLSDSILQDEQVRRSLMKTKHLETNRNKQSSK